MTDKKFIGFYCNPTLNKKIRAAAKREGRSVSGFIRSLMLQGVNTCKEAKP
jgi:hypothetical protein